MTQKCEFVEKIKDNDVKPTSDGCEKCKQEGTSWVALRMCLSCGHVGCCDSSVGLHARKHFEEKGHPVMIQLPNKSWKWCYEHEHYG